MVEQLDEVTIRVATEGDAAGIARVHVRSWQEAYAGIVPDAYLSSLDADARTAQWRKYLREGPAEVDGQQAGDHADHEGDADGLERCDQ